MKKNSKSILFAGLLAAALTGCQKESSKSKTIAPSTNLPGITLSKSTVKEGEQLTVSVQDLPPANAIRWSVSPSAGTKIVAGKGRATAYFTNAGTYQLTADYYVDSLSPAPYDSSSTPVIVTDTVYVPPPPPPAPYVDTSLAGKQLQIEPVMATDTGGLVLLVQTTQLYSCDFELQYYFAQYGNVLKLQVLGVSNYVYPGCPAGSGTAQGSVLIQGLSNGVYDFEVEKNMVTYSGTLTVTGQNYTFSWNYTSDVTISPLQIQTVMTGR